jgi:hypothetical protein
MMPRKNYQQEAEKLAKAIKVAIETFEKFKSFGLTDLQFKQLVEGYTNYERMVLNPEPQYRRLQSLQFLIEAVFTTFQEGKGEAIEYFWQRLKEERLDYTRENKLEIILNRGRIKGRIEYEYVIDMLIVAQQENLISAQQALRLNEIIGIYENKNRKTDV